MLKLSSEEIFFIKTIFGRKKISKNETTKIDYEKLTKLASSHLMLPSLYCNLISKKIISTVPIDFKKYLEEIFAINYERNTHLLKELDCISKLLKINQIDYVFLKGSALLLNNYFSNIGERMIGDIDLFVRQEHIDRCCDLLKSSNYHTEHLYKKWDTNVLPNFINKKKIFAIDIHTKLFPLSYNHLIKYSEKIVNTNKNYKTLNRKHEIYYCIYNFMIADNAKLRANHSYRKIYDLKKMNYNGDMVLRNDILMNKFFVMNNLLGIFNKKKLKKNISLAIFEKRFIMKRTSKLYYQIDKNICDIIEFIRFFKPKFIEGMHNRKYRNKIFNKLFRDKF